MKIITKLRFVLLLLIAAVTLSACTPGDSQVQTEVSSPTASPDQNVPPVKLAISQEMQTYSDENYNLTFSYPSSFDFVKQLPYPGGSIPTLGFRVDGLTESQLASNDLSQSLKSNDLYCNLDPSHGEAVCVNKNVEQYINPLGSSGFIVNREKTFYGENSDDPSVFQDIVYVFPLKEKNKAISTYKALVFSIKYPSLQNLELLKQISDTVKTY